MKLLILLLGLLFMPSLEEDNSGSISIKVEGVKVSKGVIALMVFNQEDGFPKEREKAFYKGTYPINGKIPEIRISNIPKGKYAIVMMHDINENKEMDKNFFGIPIEPFGFSGNFSSALSPPDFKEASFEVDGKETVVQIKLVEVL